MPSGLSPLSRGPVLALLAALFFGISTPLGKPLLEHMSAQWLGGLLCLGSGLGLALWMLLRRASTRSEKLEASLTQKDIPWIAAATLIGGMGAPVLLSHGLSHTPAATASLMLNLEGVFTASIAWAVFREHFDRRLFCGMISILAGSILLSWNGRPDSSFPWDALCIAGACLCWAIDNNLTRKISAADPVQITAIKGLISGGTNVAIALALSPARPPWASVISAALLGFVSYGMALVLFVLALRKLGTGRTSAYFSTAPFIGAILSLAIAWEHPSIAFCVAAALMVVGVLLHLTEHHEHFHRHEPMEHEHLHVHDEHHQHEHTPDDPPGEPHSHWHRHELLEHSHPHFPDIHHQHRH